MIAPARNACPKHLVILFIVTGVTVVTLLVPARTLTSLTTTPLVQDALQLSESGTLGTTSSATKQEPDFILDFLSVGFGTRPLFSLAQQRSFGSHPYVRNFFTVSEQDDVERNCADVLTAEQARSISQFCHSKKWGKDQFVMSTMQKYYKSEADLNKMENPAGWVCAQKRPLHGLTKAMQHYRPVGAILPDYFIIIDDDSYYNVALFHKYTKDMDCNVPLVMGGCILRFNIHEINFTIPFGGFGTIFNRAALRNLMVPISCHPAPPDDEFVKNACRRLEENQIGEQAVFQDGMNLSDLIEAYARFQPFLAHGNWTTGYCLHSDWIWAFFINFYNLSVHVSDPKYQDVAHSRLVGYMGSELNDEPPAQDNMDTKKQCNHDRVAHCTIDSHLCHYQTPESMATLTAQWLALS